MTKTKHINPNFIRAFLVTFLTSFFGFLDRMA